MAEVTAAMVKELRERTQAGMLDCKKALQEADGNMAKAVEILAKKGATKGAGKQAKIAAEGLVGAALSPDGRHGALVEVNCQTDFVARGDDFKKFVKAATDAALANHAGTVEALNALVVDGRSLGDYAIELSGRSGEKHAIRRVTHFETGHDGLLHTYVHMGSKIGVLVELRSGDPQNARVVEFADDIALQVASMNPLYLNRAEVPTELSAKQREIFSALMDKEDAEAVAAPEQFVESIRNRLGEWAREDGRELGDLDVELKEHLARSEKDAATLDGLKKTAEKARTRAPVAKEKILDGKVAKWTTEVALLEQTSIKDNKKTIGALLGELAKAVPGTSIHRFARYEVGEGIDKGPTKDFATEVAEMAGQRAS